MDASNQQVHLIVERLDAGAARWGDAPIIVTAVNPVRIDISGDMPRPQPHDRTGDDCTGLRVQLIQGDVPRLALLAAPGPLLRVNGHPAPPIAQLRGGDEIELDGGGVWRMHVAIYRAAPIGPAGEELRGRECPLCLTRFSAENEVFRCGCGVALHVAPHDQFDAPDCARAMKHCPDCRRPIVLTGGYESLPQDYDGNQELATSPGAAAGGDVRAGV
jgi:hypothetical protein